MNWLISIFSRAAQIVMGDGVQDRPRRQTSDTARTGELVPIRVPAQQKRQPRKDEDRFDHFW